MPDPRKQVQTQLANIESSTGMTTADFVASVERAQLEKHGQIVAFLKTEHGLSHGNANLVAHVVRESMAGGPALASDLLDAQYNGAKAALRPIYEALAAVANSQGDDVDQVVQKTGVSFRRSKQFALVQAPSAKRIQLGLNLDYTPNDPRIAEAGGMCSHRVDIANAREIDDDIKAWIHAAYERAR